MLGGVGASRFCSNPAARIAYAPVLIKRALVFFNTIKIKPLQKCNGTCGGEAVEKYI